MKDMRKALALSFLGIFCLISCIGFGLGSTSSGDNHIIRASLGSQEVMSATSSAIIPSPEATATTAATITTSPTPANRSEEVLVGADSVAASMAETTEIAKSPKVTKAVRAADKTSAKPAKKNNQIEQLIWMGWAIFESGEDSWASVSSDDGHAYGRYQFDDRYDLADFFRFCVKANPERYDAFTTFFHVDGNGKAHIKNTERIPEEWSWICYTEGENFQIMQTRFAVEHYYKAAKKTLRQSGIKIGDYGPVLHGTVLSLAVRNGPYASNLSSLINTYYEGISEREWLAQIYAAETVKHPDQEPRWRVRQRNAAMRALTAIEENGLTERVCKKQTIETAQLSN